MRRFRFYSFIITGISAFFFTSCSTPSPDDVSTPLPSPSASVPAGLKEVSRLNSNTKISVSDISKSDVSVEDNKMTLSQKSCQKNGDKDKNNSQKIEENLDVKENVTKEIASDKNLKKSSLSSTGIGDQTLEKTAITARGENPWTLEAQKVSYNDSTQRVRVNAIVWTLLDKEDKPRLTVRGKAADVNVESQNVAFDGPVEADGSEGEKMKVNRLVWDSAKQKILGSHGVRVVRKGTVMTGDNLVASPDLKQIEVSGNVRVTFVDIPKDVVENAL